MHLIQILLILFFLFALSRVVLRFKNNDLQTGGFVFWFVFWLLAGIIVLWPDSTFIIAKFVGITRGADLIVYLALALLFFLIFKISVKQEKINKQITKIVRSHALYEDKEK